MDTLCANSRFAWHQAEKHDSVLRTAWIHTLLYSLGMRAVFKSDVVHRISNDSNLPTNHLGLQGLHMAPGVFGMLELCCFTVRVV